MKFKIVFMLLLLPGMNCTFGQGKFGGGYGDGYASRAVNSMVTSIKNVKDQSLLKIYPNPIKNQLFIEHESSPGERLIIFDSRGVVVRRFTRVPEKISMIKMSPGIYFVKIGKHVRTVIKE